jgi:lactate permease
VTVLGSWLPYIFIGILLLIGRLQFFGLTPVLKSFTIGWNNILGTTVSRSIQPFYNPGVFPFIFIALFIPLFYRLDARTTFRAWRMTFHMLRHAALALFFTLGMVFILINSGEATGRDSMLIVMAKAAADLTGSAWYLAAPLVGVLGTFISGSHTVSNIMLGPFQLSTAIEAGLPYIPIVSLQSVGGAVGNMICIHNVVAVLTVVGLIGREGLVIRKNFPVALSYGLLAGILGWILAGVLAGFIY